jgi:predicted house-cleaning noncanonical NTP pyrophosphatase (MazG superfamily)
VTRRIYDKLLRDRIPEIIRLSGRTCGTDMFEDDDAFRRAPLDKLVEESREAATASDEDLPAELAAAASERAIMNQTGHRSTDKVRRYIRAANLFAPDNAASLAGL